MTSVNIRNFCIIAHIDHGKSTLADRFLELTGTIEKRKMREQFLDQMELERERGITIKLQPVRMAYRLPPMANDQNQEFILNLIDTPGHVDFTYEVSRSLAAVEGAILLVDATQGVQAQTLANLHLAQEQNLTIIPAINKIDMAAARVDEVENEIRQLLGEVKIYKISAKEGVGIAELLQAIITNVPPPRGDQSGPLRALIFDSVYDSYKGVLAYVRVFDGEVKVGDKIFLMGSKTQAEVLEIGILKPALAQKKSLFAGEIGYIATGLKNVLLCRVGDTITSVIARRTDPSASWQDGSGRRGPLRLSEASNPEDSGNNSGLLHPALPENFKKGGIRNDIKVEPLVGYKEPSPMVFAGFYPSASSEQALQEGHDYKLLKDSLSKLKLNDAALMFEPESSDALGRGFKCGFLGMLHLEIVSERLRREYGLDLVVTTPSVAYKIVEKKTPKEKIIFSPEDMPDPSFIEQVSEPWTKIEVVCPNLYLGAVMKLFQMSGGIYKNTSYLGAERIILAYEAPLREIIVDFYDRLKSATSGYASMSYELSGWKKGDLVKMDILAAGERVAALSRIIPRDSVEEEGRAMVKKLKDVLPKQLFAVALQAAIGGKIIARETISAMRKDVTGYLYGGDYSRKKKLLEKQKKGKKKMKAIGKLKIPQKAFLDILKR